MDQKDQIRKLTGEGAGEPNAARTPLRRRRFARSVVLVAVFFAAASFTAGAGDIVGKALDPADCAELTATGEDMSACDAVPAETVPPAETTPPTETVPVEEPAVPASEVPAETTGEPVETLPEDATVAVDPALAEQTPVESTPMETSGDELPAAPATAPSKPAKPAPAILAPEQPESAKSKASSRHWVVRRANESKATAPPVEHEGGHATVWVNRPFADPTPPAKRLSPAFARKLQRISKAHGVSWALVLAVLRAEGARDRVPATKRELNALARGLHQHGAANDPWKAALAISGRTGFADRAVALAAYNRAVGLRSLVQGLKAAKPRLVRQLLADPRATIYASGREDLRRGRIDVRVVVTIKYLAQRFGQVTVSSLFSGHRMYSRPGVVSAHYHGQAVDIATVGGVSMIGNQEQGSITDRAVRSILMLPVEVQPRQVISLLAMGGPSFAMANHDDHIHVGY
jgi:hypothetical protein